MLFPGRSPSVVYGHAQSPTICARPGRAEYRMVCMWNATVQSIKAKYTNLEPVLDERARRLWAATEARAIGRGGITRVAGATGLSRVTIRAGLSELDLPITRTDRRMANERLRRSGGGRKPLVDHDPDLFRDLETLVDPV